VTEGDRSGWRKGPLAWVLLLGASAGAWGADAPLPLTLEEVRTGRQVQLAPGAAALHVVFFATWCPPCLSELERLTELEQHWGNDGYRLVLIAVRHRNTRERLLRLSEQSSPPGTLYLDASGDAQRSFAVDGLPAHVLVDAAGRVVGRWDSLTVELEKAVERLLETSGDGS
jgi:thiol-disulfide isomerase/thioredoxin